MMAFMMMRVFADANLEIFWRPLTFIRRCSI
jgi:hypothetical protein